MNIWIAKFVGLTLAVSALASADEGFHLNELPVGKAVTLPHPATTFVPVGSRVRLTSTDLPQTVKLSSIDMPATIHVAIYDQGSDRVKYVSVAPGATVLYSFKSLTSIRLIPGKAGMRAARGRLMIESNKPLGISR